LFRFTKRDVDSIEGWLSGLLRPPSQTVAPAEYSSALINLEPGLVYPAAAGSFNGSMSITIDNNMTVEIPLGELWRPLRGLNARGEVVLNDSYNELQIYGSPVAQYASVLGKAFLSQVRRRPVVDILRQQKAHIKQVYLFVDYDAQPPVFRLTARSPNALAPVAVSSASCRGGLSAEDKGLIGLGSALGALILGLLAYVLYRRRQATPAKTEDAQTGPNKDPDTANTIPEEAVRPTPSTPDNDYGQDHPGRTRYHPRIPGTMTPPRSAPTLAEGLGRSIEETAAPPTRDTLAQ
jgi:hypothetical protein